MNGSLVRQSLSPYDGGGGVTEPLEVVVLVVRLGRHEVVVEEAVEEGEGGPGLGQPVPALEHHVVEHVGADEALAGRARHAVPVLYPLQHLRPRHTCSMDGWMETRGRHVVGGEGGE